MPSIDEATADADLVAEAILAKPDLSRTMFAELGELRQDRAVLAVNSRQNVSSKIPSVTK